MAHTGILLKPHLFLVGAGRGLPPRRSEGKGAVDRFLDLLLPSPPPYPHKPCVGSHLCPEIPPWDGSQRKDLSRYIDSLFPPCGSGKNFGDSQVGFLRDYLFFPKTREKDLNGYFTKEEMLIANKHKKMFNIQPHWS